MTEGDWLQALARSPDEDALRLAFADWLEERGDARGAYLRAEARHFHKESRRAAQDVCRLQEQVDPVWANLVSRPPFGILVPDLTFHDTGPKITRADLGVIERHWGSRSHLTTRPSCCATTAADRASPICIPTPCTRTAWSVIMTRCTSTPPQTSKATDARTCG